ncbi:MAG: hypothetical protein KIT72_00430 [Polyangiaceae bacterium]|nr:hypothetical protein [Polyangiaceae bacterium]MCW5788862.1 hypothetical protein [Polyangiaceae bacterium]
MAAQNPKVAFGIVGVVFALLGVGWGVSAFIDHREEQALAESGELGVAKILSYEETGSYQNKRPRVLFHMEITPAKGGPPIRVETKRFVSTMEAPRLQVGSTRQVRYLPEDPEVFRFLD